MQFRRIFGKEISDVELNFQLTRNESSNIGYCLGNHEAHTRRSALKYLLVRINHGQGIARNPSIGGSDLRTGMRDLSDQFGDQHVKVRWRQITESPVGPYAGSIGVSKDSIQPARKRLTIGNTQALSRVGQSTIARNFREESHSSAGIVVGIRPEDERPAP